MFVKFCLIAAHQYANFLKTNCYLLKELVSNSNSNNSKDSFNNSNSKGTGNKSNSINIRRPAAASIIT